MNNPVETAARPWYRHPRTNGDWVVIWWVPVRNQRGTRTLHPKAVSFATEADAREAAADHSTAAKVDLRFRGDAALTLWRAA